MATKPLALVTGGVQGIGFACAQALAELGATPIISDINAEGLDAVSYTHLTLPTICSV